MTKKMKLGIMAAVSVALLLGGAMLYFKVAEQRLSRCRRMAVYP